MGLRPPLKAVFYGLRKHCVRWKGQGGIGAERPPGLLLDSYPQDHKQHLKDADKIHITGLPQRELNRWPEDRLIDKLREMPFVRIAGHMEVEGGPPLLKQ